MNNFSLIRSLLFVFAAVFMASCDTDYNQLGSDVVSADIHNSIVPYQGHVIAYNKTTGPVQTNGMVLNLLGAYDNPVFGRTKASFVTQISLNSIVPDVNSTAVIDSAWIYIPYYSTLRETTSGIFYTRTESINRYTLDSVYGDSLAMVKFDIRENNYYLRGFEAGTTDAQRYYSDQAPLFQGSGQSLLDHTRYPSGTYDTIFKPDEIKRRADYTDDDGNVTHNILAEQLAPGLFAYLDKAYLTTKILHAPADVLANDNVFQNYMRGLYITAEPMNGGSVMAMPKFEAGYIKIVYTQDNQDTTEDLTDKESITLTLPLTGSKVNVYENTLSGVYSSGLAATNPVAGDSKLYVKGGEGSIALIDILSDQDIAFLKQEKAIINEANLTFYVDRSTMGVTNGHGQAVEPLRLFLYDVNNKRPVYDFYTDGTSSTSFPKYSKYVYGGLLEVDNAKRGVRYKLRITDHVNNIINKDSTNVKLGLSVTETINNVTNSYIKNPFTDGTIPVETVPTGTVMHPFGTVLYGTNLPADNPYRLKLEIFYTKPEE